MTKDQLDQITAELKNLRLNLACLKLKRNVMDEKEYVKHVESCILSQENIEKVIILKI